jgi:hypothetical protein
MRNKDVFETLKKIDPSSLITLLRNGISVETLNLEANEVLRNEGECLKVKHRIADGELFIMVLRGDLPA